MLDNGDSTLIITNDNKKILIDGGGSTDLEKYNVGEKVLLPYLLDRKIKSLDYVFISHFDSDHCNGLIPILEELNVKNIVLTKQSEQTLEYLNIMKIVKDKKINTLFLNKGSKIQFNGNTYVTCLYPEEKLKFNDLNNNSMVLKLVYNEFSIIFTGDIEEKAERFILLEYKNTKMLESTILKISHHGSKTSTTEEFLKRVNPKFALIGVGENNNFGHPSELVLERLKSVRL